MSPFWLVDKNLRSNCNIRCQFLITFVCEVLKANDSRPPFCFTIRSILMTSQALKTVKLGGCLYDLAYPGRDGR